MFSRLGGRSTPLADDGVLVFRKSVPALEPEAMNDDDPAAELEALRAEHRALDEQIALLSLEGATDQLELARLKRRKLFLKDKIQLILDSNTPDIIA